MFQEGDYRLIYVGHVKKYFNEHSLECNVNNLWF